MTVATAHRRRMIAAMILTYMMFGVLLNSVGTVILQSIQGFGIDKAQASILEAFKDLPIAVVSFLTASLLPRLGYRRAMMLGLGLVLVACALMPLLASFWMTKALFIATGVAFALVKVSVYSSIGLLTDSKQAHASLTSIIEGWFMVGVLAGYWIFAWFIDPRGDIYPCAGMVGHKPARFGSIHEPFARMVDALAYTERSIDTLSRRGPRIPEEVAHFPADLCALHRQSVHGIASL